MTMIVPEPSAEQCYDHEPIALPDGRTAYALWYPQMGGYVSRCLVAADGHGCFDAWVWHDGDFPFSGDNPYRETTSPRELHHCDPGHFIVFGRLVEELLGDEED